MLFRHIEQVSRRTGRTTIFAIIEPCQTYVNQSVREMFLAKLLSYVSKKGVNFVSMFIRHILNK